MPVVDSDQHVTEPADLWTRAGLPIAGHAWTGLTIEGVKMPDIPWDQFDPNAVDHHVNLGPLHVEAEAKGWGPQTTLDAMNREGIDLAVLFPTRAGWLLGSDELDPVLVARACDVYNAWIANYCVEAKKLGGPRVAAVGITSFLDPQLAVATAAHAVHELKLWGVATRPNPLHGKTLDHPDYGAIYSALGALNVPLIFHEGTGAKTPTLGWDRAHSRLEAHVMSHPFEQMSAVLAFTAGGIFARHPDLRVGFFEAGTGWLPYWLGRLDDHALGPFSAHYEHPLRPGRYFRRQGWVTFDTEALYGIEEEGLAGNVLFASDWPHGDSHHPHSCREGRTAAGKLWGRVSYDNAAAFWQPGRAA